MSNLVFEIVNAHITILDQFWMAQQSTSFPSMLRYLLPAIKDKNEDVRKTNAQIFVSRSGQLLVSNMFSKINGIARGTISSPPVLLTRQKYLLAVFIIFIIFFSC